jgi:predicted DCC family thiol-disulfide oxidoreductase YuxK
MNAIERQAILLTGPWVLYDGTCRVCRGSVVRFGPTLRRRGFRFATLQSEIGRAFDPGNADEMKVLLGDGTIIGGAEGMAHLCRHIWWARPLAWLWRVPAMRPYLRRAYARFAARRHCASVACDPSHSMQTGA